jgi:Raf kinase inhibitor-like YbhB/YbcL family protein
MYKRMIYFFCLFIFFQSGFALEVISNAFTSSTSLPSKYTCDGLGVNPQLSWSDVPVGTKSFVLIVDDPDAQTKVLDLKTNKQSAIYFWTHWVLYNIPPDLTLINENAIISSTMDVGVNSWARKEYGAPCPPLGSGIHHYYFKLYALDTMLDNLNNNVTKQDLQQAMQQHLLGKAELIGLYQR